MILGIPNKKRRRFSILGIFLYLKIVYLNIDDKLLRVRSVLRGVNFETARNMNNKIKQEVFSSNIPVITVNVR